MPRGRGSSRTPSGFYGRNVHTLPDRSHSFYGSSVNEQALAQTVAPGFLRRENVNTQHYTWSAAHMLVDDVDRKKFTPNSDPLEQEDSIPFMKGWGAMASEYAMVKLADEITALQNPVDVLANGTRVPREPTKWEKALLSAYAKETVKGKKMHFETRFHNEFANRFREWIRGNGSSEEYKAAGMESYVGDDSKRNKNTPISDHDSVLNYLEQWQKRVMDYDVKKTKMKLRMGRGGAPGEAASIEDLWKYYKFVVYGLPVPEMASSMELFTQPVDDLTTLMLPPPLLNNPSTVVQNNVPPPPAEDRARQIYAAPKAPPAKPKERAETAPLLNVAEDRLDGDIPDSPVTEPVEAMRDRQKSEESAAEAAERRQMIADADKQLKELAKQKTEYEKNIAKNEEKQTQLLTELVNTNKQSGAQLADAAKALKEVAAAINLDVSRAARTGEYLRTLPADVDRWKQGGELTIAGEPVGVTPDARVAHKAPLPGIPAAPQPNVPEPDDVSQGVSALRAPYNLVAGARDVTPAKPSVLRTSADAVGSVLKRSADAVRSSAASVGSAIAGLAAASTPVEPTIDQYAEQYNAAWRPSADQWFQMGTKKYNEIVARARAIRNPAPAVAPAQIDTSIPIVTREEFNRLEAERIQKLHAEEAAKVAAGHAAALAAVAEGRLAGVGPAAVAPAPAAPVQPPPRASPKSAHGVSWREKGFFDAPSILPQGPPQPFPPENKHEYGIPVTKSSQGAIYRESDHEVGFENTDLIKDVSQRILGDPRKLLNDIHHHDALDATDQKMLRTAAEEIKRNQPYAGKSPPEWKDTAKKHGRIDDVPFDKNDVAKGIDITIAENIKQGRGPDQMIKEFADSAKRNRIPLAQAQKMIHEFSKAVNQRYDIVRNAVGGPPPAKPAPPAAAAKPAPPPAVLKASPVRAPLRPTVTVASPPSPGSENAKLNESTLKALAENEQKANKMIDGLVVDHEEFEKKVKWSKTDMDRAVGVIEEYRKRFDKLKEEHERYATRDKDGNQTSAKAPPKVITQAARTLRSYVNSVLNARGTGNKLNKKDGLPSMTMLKGYLDHMLGGK